MTMLLKRLNAKSIHPCCEICGKELTVGPIDYVLTKRGTHLFFHRKCLNKDVRA